MSTVADAARPVGAPPSPVRHGLCRLTLRIGGTDYRLRPCPPETNVLAAWSLRKLDPHASARYVVAAPKGKPAHCTCPDHERSGWTCKHLGALLALGLLPAPKPSTAKGRKFHAKNARLAIAEAKGVAVEDSPARSVLATGHPSPATDRHPSAAAEFAAGFQQAVVAHVARIGRGGYEICDGCGINFDPYTSGNPNLCHGCARDGVA